MLNMRGEVILPAGGARSLHGLPRYGGTNFSNLVPQSSQAYSKIGMLQVRVQRATIARSPMESKFDEKVQPFVRSLERGPRPSGKREKSLFSSEARPVRTDCFLLPDDRL